MSQAVQFSEYGTADKLSVADVPTPEPGPGQVRLAVRAASVNPIDWKILRGLMAQGAPLDQPRGLGSDVAGVVEAIGDGVEGIAVGDELFGASVTPSFATQALADAAALVPKPAAVSWEVAGSLAGVGGTAFKTLELLDVKPGETLLVHAAAGGVGTLWVQLALARGIRVIGTASEANHARLRSYGAEPVLYGDGLAERVRALAPDGVNAVLDASGRGELTASVELAGGPQRILSIAGFAEGPGLGVKLHVGGGGADTPRALRELVPLIAEGRIEVPIARTYSLDGVADALRASEDGHLTGKLVIVPA